MTAMLIRWKSWELGYWMVGGILLTMTALFLATRARWNDPVPAKAQAQPPVGMRAALAQPLVWLQTVLFFVYVGLEFTVGQWCFTLLTESRGVSPDVAGILAGTYYGAIGVGRIVSGAVTHRLGLDLLVRLAMLLVLVGAGLFAFGWPREVGYAGLALTGLGLAPIFPCLMARTPERLGTEYAKHAVGFQVSAGMLGAALVPGLAGLFVEQLGLEIVPRFAVLLAALLFATHEVLLRSAHRAP
jgi:fucose permease